MKLVIIVLSLCLLSSCSKYVIITNQSLSRELNSIQFNKSNQPYKVKQQVGGEQINSTVIKAKKNDTFKIEVLAENESLNFYIDGSNITDQILGKNPIIRKVIATEETEIELSFSAYPLSCFYDLKITRL